MTIESALLDLKAAYDQVAHELNKVAHEIESRFPKAWAKANEMFDGNVEGAVLMLSKRHTPGWGNDISLLEVADKYGEDEVVNYMEAIMAGSYM